MIRYDYTTCPVSRATVNIPSLPLDKCTKVRYNNRRILSKAQNLARIMQNMHDNLDNPA